MEETRENPFNEEYQIKHKLTNGIVDDEVKEYVLIRLPEIYEQIQTIIKYYVDLPDESLKLISIWILGTYFHKGFKTYPFLFLNAMRGSGKTRLLRLINYLSYKGEGRVTNSVTEAVLFRHPKHQIMCIDEIEGIGKKENATLRELLNSAYKRGMQVKRMRKVRVNGQEQQAVETFEPFFPIAMANIWGLEEVLQDRAITITLEKSSNNAVTKKAEDFDENNYIASLSSLLTLFSVVSVDVVTKKTSISAWNSYVDSKYNYIYNIYNNNNTNYIYNTISSFNKEEKVKEIEQDEFFMKLDDSGISGRNLELFLPLLTVAFLLGDKNFKEVLEISKNMVQLKRDDEYSESKDVSLYQFVADHGDSKEFVSIKVFTDHFRLFNGDTQATDEAWCNEKWVGRALKRLSLVKQKKRLASGIYVIVNTEKAKEKIKIFQ